MLGMEMALHVQLIGVAVLCKIHIQQFVHLDFFPKKVMVYMWQGMILTFWLQIFSSLSIKRDLLMDSRVSVLTSFSITSKKEENEIDFFISLTLCPN